MTVSKELKFSFSLDSESFQKVKISLEQLTNQAQKLAQALNNAGGGFGIGGRGGGGGGLIGGGVSGGNVGGGGFTKAAGTGANTGTSSMAKSVMMTADSFKSLGAISEKALKAMKENVKSAFDTQVQASNKAAEQLRILGNMWESLEDKGSESGKAMVKTIESQADALIKAKEKAKEYSDTLKKMSGEEVPKGPGTAPGKNNITGLLSGGAGSALSMLGLGSPLAVLAALAKTGVTGLNVAQGINNAPLNAEARRGRSVGAALSSLYSGDNTELVLQRAMAKEASVDAAAFTKRYGGNVFEALQTVGGIKENMKGLAGHGSIDNLTEYQLETGKMEALQEGRKQFAQTTRAQNALIANEVFMSSMSERVGYNQFFGRGQNRLKKDPVTGRFMAANASTDPFLNEKAELERSGYSIGQKMAAAQQAMGIGGMAMRGAFTGQIMNANAGGFGGLGEALAMTARASGQTLLGKGGGAATREMTRGYFGGGIDPIAAMHLAQITTRGGFDVTGTTSGQGLLAAIQSSNQFGQGIQDMQAINRIQAGVQAGNVMTQGGTGYNQAFRTLNAISAAGEGASTQLQDYLASGMSMAQLMDAARGEGTETFKGLGGTRQMARAMLAQTGESYLAQYAEQGSGSAVDKAVAKYKASGMTLQDYIRKNPKDKKALAVAANISSGNQLTEEGAISAFSMIGGNAEGKIIKGKLPGAGKMDQVAQADADKNFETAQERARVAYENIDVVFGKDGELSKTIKTLTNFGQNLIENADLASAALYELAGAANAAKAVRDRINERERAAEAAKKVTNPTDNPALNMSNTQ